jgi:hypothetical protein
VALAEGEARSKELIGKGESSRIAQVGLAEAAVTLQKVGAYRDPRLYALNVFAEQFSHSVQPLAPNRLFINNAGGKDGEGQPGGGNVLETLLSLILSEKAGINISGMLPLLGHWRTSSRSSPATEDNRIEVRLSKRRRPPRRLASEIILARTDQFSWIERKNGRCWLLTPEEPEAFVRAVSG